MEAGMFFLGSAHLSTCARMYAAEEKLPHFVSYYYASAVQCGVNQVQAADKYSGYLSHADLVIISHSFFGNIHQK